MYSLIVLDDEEIVRSALRKYFDWESIGFEVIAEFEDGTQAVEFLRDHAVDVILTDVQMYQMSGIELAQYVSEHIPETKIVIISGYMEFTYAKEAMKYGVRDYLLKPVQTNEMKETFLRLAKVIEAEKKRGLGAMLDAQEIDQQQYRNIIAINRQIIDVILVGDTTGIRELHNHLFDVIGNLPFPLSSYIVSSLIEGMFDRFAEMGLEMEASLRKDKVFEQIHGTSAEMLYQQTERILLEFTAFVYSRKKNPENLIILEAKKHIQENLGQSLSVEDIAANLFLSSGYFSRLFKKNTGENVIEYIIKCRVQRAIELIKEQKYKAMEISAIVGYSDCKYFYGIFKKHTGYTITEYQKLYQHKKKN